MEPPIRTLRSNDFRRRPYGRPVSGAVSRSFGRPERESSDDRAAEHHEQEPEVLERQEVDDDLRRAMWLNPSPKPKTSPPPRISGMNRGCRLIAPPPTRRRRRSQSRSRRGGRSLRRPATCERPIRRRRSRGPRYTPSRRGYRFRRGFRRRTAAKRIPRWSSRCPRSTTGRPGRSPA